MIWLLLYFYSNSSKKSQDDKSTYNPVYRQSNRLAHPVTNQNIQGQCPRCGSNNLQALNQTAKVQRGFAYQLFMALLFVMSFGILWLLLGNVRKKVTQTYIVCLNCGYKRLI